MRAACFGLTMIAMTPALADIAPSPAIRNGPYIDALAAAKRACGTIVQRTLVEGRDGKRYEARKLSGYDLICSNGKQYRMVVKHLPRQRRSRIDRFDVIEIRETKL